MNVFKLKAAVARLARGIGYRVERIVEEVPNPLDVFGVLVHQLAELRGRDFTFIQVGAHDGMVDDPIRKYVRGYHWRGVLVEPQPTVFARLVENYRDEPQLAFENAAISAQDGEAILYMPGDESVLATLLATFDKSVLQRRLGKSAPIRELRVPSLTIATLLAKHEVRHVDLLQVDAEGFDFEIIQMFDQCGTRPSLIRFEHYNFTPAKRRACFDFLASRDYHLLREGIDVVACQPVLWKTPATTNGADRS